MQHIKDNNIKSSPFLLYQHSTITIIFLRIQYPEYDFQVLSSNSNSNYTTLHKDGNTHGILNGNSDLRQATKPYRRRSGNSDINTASFYNNIIISSTESIHTSLSRNERSLPQFHYFIRIMRPRSGTDGTTIDWKTFMFQRIPTREGLFSKNTGL